MTPNWRTLAAQKYVGITCNGSGRFCVLSCDRKSCWLVADERTAHGAALGSCHMVVPCRCEHTIIDLKPVPVPDIADDWEDKQRARRQAK